MKYEIKSKKKPKEWVDGYFIGNGTLGGIVMCDLKKERVIFTHEKLFLHTTELENFPCMDDVFREAREQCTPQIAQRFFEIAQQRGLKNKVLPEDTMLYPDSFFPAFELEINGNVEKCESYERKLNTSTGEVTVIGKEGNNQITERIHISHVQNGAYMNVKSEKEKDFIIKLSMVKPINQREERLCEVCIKKCAIVVHEGGIQLRTDMNKGFYCGELCVKTDGKVIVGTDLLTIKDAKDILLNVSVGVNEMAPYVTEKNMRRHWPRI